MKTIPDYLIYEMVDGQPIYYRGYQEVVQGDKEAEAIMGSSYLQSLFISRIFRFLIINLSEEFETLTNEIGLQFTKGNWRAADLAIYQKSTLQDVDQPHKYLSIPPDVVIEVDTKADFEQFTSSAGYYYTKTESLLEFGVKKVIWIFTDARKVMVAEPQQDWLVKDWEQDIVVLPGVVINIAKLLAE